MSRKFVLNQEGRTLRFARPSAKLPLFRPWSGVKGMETIAEDAGAGQARPGFLFRFATTGDAIGLKVFARHDRTCQPILHSPSFRYYNLFPRTLLRFGRPRVVVLEAVL